MNKQTRSRSNFTRAPVGSPVARSIQALGFGFLLLLLLMLAFPSDSRVQASGVVGTGTPSSCSEAALDAALVGGGTVAFNCGGAVTITVTRTKTISSDTTIDGGNLVTLSGAHAVRIFSINQGVTLNLKNLTMADTYGDYGSSCIVLLNLGGTVNIDHSSFLNNFSSLRGGAICNGDTLYPFDDSVMTISSSTFSGNGVGGKGGAGGAIHNSHGELTITNSTFLTNYALSGGAISTAWGMVRIESSTFLGNDASTSLWPTGGGAIAINSGSAIIANSTFSDNTASIEGGGLRLVGSTVAITNTTFNGNSATTQGGAIYSSGGSLSLIHSTFSGNNATTQGGGIYNADATITLYNTIVADTISGGNCAGSITDGGSNLDSGTTCGFATTSGSQSNTSPQLGPFANNGGPTRTMSLLPGSPAIDAVGDATHCAATDQRGVFRPQGPACDIGAFESIAPSLFLPLLGRN